MEFIRENSYHHKLYKYKVAPTEVSSGSTVCNDPKATTSKFKHPHFNSNSCPKPNQQINNHFNTDLLEQFAAEIRLTQAPEVRDIITKNFCQSLHKADPLRQLRACINTRTFSNWHKKLQVVGLSKQQRHYKAKHDMCDV